MTKIKSDEQITNYFISSFENNTIPWRKPYTPGGLTISTPKRSNSEYYNGINTVVLLASALAKGFTSPYWFTYKQCMEAGGNIQKNMKGTRVIKYGQIDKTDPKVPEKEVLVPYIISYTVFNISQAENLPGEYVYDRTVSEPVKHSISDVVEACGVKILTGFDAPCYLHHQDHIRLPNQKRFKSHDAFACTVMHELVHATGHESRVGRVLSGDETSESYMKEELIAELGAVMLCARLGIPTDFDNRHVPYVKHWLKGLKNNPKFILKASAAAQKAVNYIMSQYERSAQMSVDAA